MAEFSRLSWFLTLAILLAVVQADLFTPRHCTWHGTAPMCLPSCPMGKRSVVESKCGPNKLVCCVTGNKKLCCPKNLDIDPQTAIAIAKNG
ncbi:hypothetical protein BV898_16693 [Hypsibius exemplaris]|uniref:Uncharacterized protein n=1 Tax=Hypsibius exemplaris TaxID=2072580 RepID=A0A9X6RLH6_HYPEX|nr:hypothetical protein BV898_16693 [Hypsibius exemplaris]